MPKRRTLVLDARQRKQLEELRDHDKRPYLRERCGALLKIADGHSPHWVSQHGLLKRRKPKTVYSWLDIYEDEGIDGLIARQHGGYRRGRL